MKVVRTSTIKLGHTRAAIVLASQVVSDTVLCEGDGPEQVDGL